jgi:hypothetical protein
LAKNSLLGCDNVSDNTVTREGSLGIVKISEEGVYAVTAGVGHALMVTAAGLELMLVSAVVVVMEASKSMASSSTAAISLIDVNGMLVFGYC